MSKVSDNLLGMTLDTGSAMLIREAAVAETGNAAISNVLLQTYKFAGSSIRHEYLMPQMTELHWAMRAFENRIPDCELLMSRARETDQPSVAIACYDEMLRLAVGSSSVPALRVIPGVGILLNAYKTAEGLSDGLYGRYSYPGYAKSDASVGAVNPIPPANLASLALGINFNGGLLWMLPDEIDALNDLITVWKTWTALNVDPTDLGEKDISALYRSFGVYGLEPDWYTAAQVSIDPETGAIRINGEVYETEAEIAPYFPNLQQNYRGTTRSLAAWAASHNRAVVRSQGPINVANVQRVRANNMPAVGDMNQVVIRDGPQLRTVTLPPGWDVSPLRGVLFRCEINGVTEHMYFNLDDMRNNPIFGGTANTNQLIVRARDMAAVLWSANHGGRARGPQVAEIARRILTIRDNAARSESVVPTVRETLSNLAQRLAGVTDQRVAAIVATVMAAPMNTVQGINTVMDAIRPDLEDIRPILPKVSQLITPAAGNFAQQPVPAAAQQAGLSYISKGRYAPTATQVTALLPVLGRGVVPATFAINGAQLEISRVHDVAVVLEEPPITVYSPIRTMIATALLWDLLGRLDGDGPNFGVPQDAYDGLNPYGVGHTRPCAHTILNRQIQRYAEALVTEIENAEVDQLPDILRAVDRLTDAQYFLNYAWSIVDSIIERDDWIYALQSLLVSAVTAAPGAQVENGNGDVIRSVSAGTIPPRAVQFIFDNVLDEIRNLDSYQYAIDMAQNMGLRENPRLNEYAAVQRTVRGEVMLERARRGLELLCELVDGSNALVKNVHVTSIVEMQDLRRHCDLMNALKSVIDRDFLGLVNRAEFDTPWEVAEWATQFAAFAFSVTDQPIEYDVVDKAAEIAADSGMTAVAAALSRVGFNWTEIAPATMRVRGVGQSLKRIMPPTTGVGQGGQMFNNAPISHQTLKVTTVAPTYDLEEYGLLKAYLTLNTSRTYFPQPVDQDVSDLYSIRLPAAAAAPLVEAITGPASAGAFRAMLASMEGWQIEKAPALANVAMILPYVSAYLTKAAITRDLAVPQLIDIDAEKSLAMFSGVLMTTLAADPRVLGATNGLAVTVVDRHTISTALPWTGA